MDNVFTTFVVFLTMLLGSLFTIPNHKTDVSTDPFLSYATVTAEVVTVIDGDTIDVRIGSTSEITRIRYIGIDTPEPYQKGAPECGSMAATDANRTLLQTGDIAIVPGQDRFDPYGRLLAYVYVDTLFVNETLIREGFARTLMIGSNQDFSTRFRGAERDAEWASKGSWAACW